VIQFIYESDKELFESAFRFAQRQVRHLIETHPDFYPMYTANGIWKHGGPAWTHWCDGFLPGMMWLFVRHLGADSGEAKYWTEQAIHYSKPLEPRKNDRDVHDLGFIFLSTYYRWYRMTRDPAIREVVIQAGRTLAKRFNDNGQYLRSFVAEDSIFIDIMMNVGIIFYAARETSDRRLRDVAVRHCITTRRYLVRGDGSTAHEGIFDLETGEFLRQSTQQGFRGDSCWSRGLTWALYGFTTSYEYSRDPRFLHTAEACADYYITHTPADGVPPWDYNAPHENRSLVGGNSGGRLAAPVPPRGRSHEGSLLLVDRDSHPAHTLHGLPGKFRSQVGGRLERRRLPPSQKSGRRRIRDVGRILFNRSAGRSAPDSAHFIAGPDGALSEWPKQQLTPQTAYCVDRLVKPSN
jgi:unsaturated chondroitin disaccharide hydrolase